MFRRVGKNHAVLLSEIGRKPSGYWLIGEERGALRPCSSQRRRLPPPDCYHSDAHSDMARTSPTSDLRRASFRSDRVAPTTTHADFDGGCLLAILSEFGVFRSC